MRIIRRLLILPFLFALPLIAQISNPSIIPVQNAPSGACSQVLPDQQTIVAGVVYTCQNGTWGAISGGGGGGLPTATAAGQMYSSTAAGTTAAVQGQIFWNQTGDTIASIEAECSSLCTYVVTVPQTITLSSSHAMNSNVNLLFYAGGEWTVNGAFTLSNLQVNTSSTPTQHFAGSSTVTFSQTQVADYADWFGAVGYTTFSAATTGTDSTAAFQAAASALQIGSVRMLGMFYRTTGVVNFSKSNVGMVGPEATATVNTPTTIVDTSATGNILNASGAFKAVFKYFTLARSVTDTGSDSGFYASEAGCLLVQNVHSSDSLYPFYSNQTPSCAGSGGFYNDTAEWCDNGVTAPSGTPIGFFLDSANGLPEDSITLRDDGVSNHCGSNINAVGRQISGTAINDVNSYNFNTAGMNIGSIVNGSGTTGCCSAQDIHLIADTHDSFYTYGELVENIAAAQRATVTIADAWLSGSGSSTAAVRIISSSSVTVTHGQIKPTTGSAYYASGSDSLILANNQISETTTTSGNPAPVEFSGVSHSTITGNTVNATSGNFNSILYLTGSSTYNSITGNKLGGVSTNGFGIGIDAGSNNNNCCAGNSVDLTNITSATAVSDAGTNDGLLGPVGVVNPTAAAHVQEIIQYAPNAVFGSGTCFVYGRLGVKNATNDYVDTRFGCNGDGSTANWYGWEFGGASTYNAQMFPNLSFEFGETTPAAGPANGIAVGTTGQATIDGSGNGTFTKVNVASARKGTFVCTNAGTITIANINVVLASDVLITLNTPGGTPLNPSMQTKTAATGFTVLCGAADTSTYNFDVLN